MLSLISFISYLCIILQGCPCYRRNEDLKTWVHTGLLTTEELSVKIEPTVGSLVNQEEELGKLQIKQESTEASISR